MKKIIFIGTFIIAIGFTIRFFCGVYIHDEFLARHFFIKHRPTWKWTFYSPVRMSDTKFEELSKEQQTEQKYFNEFVTDQGLSR